jgi:hypothetical protein
MSGDSNPSRGILADDNEIVRIDVQKRLPEILRGQVGHTDHCLRNPPACHP